MTLNRPERGNSLNHEIFDRLDEAWERFDNDDDAWVAIITGAGITVATIRRCKIPSVNVVIPSVLVVICTVPCNLTRVVPHVQIGMIGLNAAINPDYSPDHRASSKHARMKA